MKKELIRWMSTWPDWAKAIVYNVWLKTTRAGRVANERERLVVSSWDELVGCGEFYHVMHAHRYWWTVLQIKNCAQKILDLGCGSGYGTWYLATNYHFVQGYDPDAEAISWAQDHFKDAPTDTLVYTTSLDQSIKYEIITCFEVLEHDPEKVLDTIFNHLQEGGTLYISTPNAHPSSVRTWLLDRGKVTMNHTHIKEYTPDEFLAVLEPHFEKVTIFGQVPLPTRNFHDYEEWRRTRDVKIEDFVMHPTDFTNCEVLYAVCQHYIPQEQVS